MKRIIYCATIVILLVCRPSAGRSIHRPHDPKMPTLRVSWEGSDKSYVVKSYYLQEYPFFKVANLSYLMRHELPDAPISYRHDNQQVVNGLRIKQQIDQLINEIHKKKTKFTDFVLLQDKDFNRNSRCGLIVVKSKHYPFVVKLFMEHPESFINPYNKGIEPIFFYFMGGGVNRHLTGLTRIRNRELVLEKLAQSPTWKDRVDIPRKWFWLPAENRWMILKGYHIGSKEYQELKIPSVYCIIADAIEADRKFSLKSVDDRNLALELCNDIQLNIDPHITNFIIEKESKKLVIIDTEHFPTIVGLEARKTFPSYFAWYSHLVAKFCKDTLFTTKRERRLKMSNPNPNHLCYPKELTDETCLQ